VLHAVVAVTRVRVLNGSFDRITLTEAVEALVGMIGSGARGYVATVNVAILMMMRSDRRLQAFVDRAALIVADGQPLVAASRWISNGLPERVTGIELVVALFDRAEREHFGVYLLGARPAVAAAAARRVRDRWPGLKLCGVANGYFSAEEAPARAQAVAQSGAQILIVGMGVPRQEYFVEEQWEALGTIIAVGVGGSLDVLAGARRRAPKALQRLGLEWLFRLAQEPRRLWKRYLVTNSQFLYLLTAEWLRARVDLRRRTRSS
jgi:N-acetylglucosaminyldiphosphoundecaprenol N-acetyl-beta-D-mannosaminyltransferase